MNKLKLQIPAGAWDYLPEECAEKRRIEASIRTAFQKSGYAEIETPSFEHYEVFMHDSVPYVQENMIKFFDMQGRILALRPDITGPIARLAATKLFSPGKALRLCYIQNAYGFFHHGLAGKTEFTQAGVELIGKREADADAEVIALAIQCLLDVGIHAFKIELGQVGYFKGLLSDANLSEEQTERIRLLIDTKNSVELEYELYRLNISEETKHTLLELGSLFGGAEVLERATQLAGNPICRAAVENLREVYLMLCDYGYQEYLSIDFGILNNFNYYSGILFRGIAGGIGTPILSGGRYDELLGEFGVSAPATGFAMGIKELLVVLDQNGKLTYTDDAPTLVVCCNDRQRKAAYQYVRQQRQQGKKVILDCSGDACYEGPEYQVIEFEEN